MNAQHTPSMIGPTPSRSHGLHQALWLLVAASLGLLAGCHRAYRPVPNIKMHALHEQTSSQIHLLQGPKGVILIGAGDGQDSSKIEQRLHMHGISPNQIQAIVLPHLRAHQAGGAEYFHKQYGTRIIATQMLPEGQTHSQASKAACWENTPLASGDVLLADIQPDGVIGYPTPLRLIADGFDAGEVFPMNDCDAGALGINLGSGAWIPNIPAGTSDGGCALIENILKSYAPKAQRFFSESAPPLKRAHLEDRLKQCGTTKSP